MIKGTPMVSLYIYMYTPHTFFSHFSLNSNWFIKHSKRMPIQIGI